MKKKLILAVVFAGIMSFNNNLLAQKTIPKSLQPKETGNKSPVTMESEMFKQNMRKLWEDHIVWTRNVIFCLVDTLNGTDQAVNRLMKNQDDIGMAIKPFYGDAASNKLSALLRSHISIAAEVINSAKVGNKPMLDDANKRWNDNADEISEFLCAANPNWKLEEMKKMMHDHLNLTTLEVVGRITKEYDADVKNYDNVHNEILQMSDMISDGIIKQFPSKFQIVLSGK